MDCRARLGTMQSHFDVGSQTAWGFPWRKPPKRVAGNEQDGMQPVASDRSDAIEIDRIADASRAHRGQAARTRGRANVKQSNRRSRRVSILPGLRLDARAQFQQISTPSPETARAVRSKGAASRTITNRANSVRSAILQDGTSTIWRAFFSRRITASFRAALIRDREGAREIRRAH